MAEEQKPAAQKAKRRVRTVETVRQQQAKRRQVQANAKPSRRRTVGRWFGTPFRWVGSWKIWRSKALKPVRFIAKLIGYILFVPYLKNSFGELKQVTWPDWKQSWRLTWAVLVFSIFFGVIVAVVDFGLDKLFKKLILNS